MLQSTLRPTNQEVLPNCLKAVDVATILGISRARAYSLIKSRGFPRITIGKRVIIPKAAFIDWMTKNTVIDTVEQVVG